MKKTFIISIALSIIAIILSISTLLLIKEKNKIDIDDFSISKVHLSKETNHYSYSDDYISYKGEAEISCADKKNDYLLIYKVKLVSGGSNSDEKYPYEYNSIEIVHNGIGTIETYDYGENIEKPVYEIEPLSFIKLEK